ncbi:MAG: phosphate ABC transporter substrate-binding protein PstS [candidate division KSB1 bacterium]|nr:phosphate ABC transporter substrate-binding protein PstS [candidate division KSB1 bacterium]
MRRTALVVASCLVWGTSAAQTFEGVLQGAGATFPYPLYARWADQYKNLTGVRVNYQSIGSGGGIAQIRAKTVDFGASDAPLTPTELATDGLVQFPMIIGGVVPVVNLPGIGPGQLRLTPEVLADIFLGKIQSWDDRRIAELNRDLRLPRQRITVVHRADGSGTTWIFTHYLDQVSPAWHEKVGVGKAVEWPVGIGGKGNEGVSAYVQRVKGAIGYVEYAYALQNHLAYVLLRNQDGRFVAPTIESFQAAAINAAWEKTPGFDVVLTNQPGEDSWPITGASFILVHKEQSDYAKAKAMFQFFDWCYRHGEKAAVGLHYVPIPLGVVEMIESMWEREVRCGGNKVWERSR